MEKAVGGAWEDGEHTGPRCLPCSGGGGVREAGTRVWGSQTSGPSCRWKTRLEPGGTLTLKRGEECRRAKETEEA